MMIFTGSIQFQTINPRQSFKSSFINLSRFGQTARRRCPSERISGRTDKIFVLNQLAFGTIFQKMTEASVSLTILEDVEWKQQGDNQPRRLIFQSEVKQGLTIRKNSEQSYEIQVNEPIFQPMVFEDQIVDKDKEFRELSARVFKVFIQSPEVSEERHE